MAVRPPAVILSAAKDLRTARGAILRCAQDDSRASVNTYGAATTILFPLPTFFANIQLSDVGWAWRRHCLRARGAGAPPLLYTVCPSCSSIGVSKDASAMPGPATSVALCLWSQVPLPFPSGFTP